MIKFLDLYQVNQTYKDELKQAFDRVLESGWYIMGQELKQFEEDFAEYKNLDYGDIVYAEGVVFKTIKGNF